MSGREKLIELISECKSCDEEIGCKVCNYVDYLDCDTARIADHLISNGVTVQEWIPVDPNKRAHTGDRLIALSNGLVTVGHQNGNGVWVYWRDGIIHGTINVTHWMPLPEPPKECE